MSEGCSDGDQRACDEILDLLHAYIDAEIVDADVSTVARHLEACRRCGLEFETYRELKALLRRSGNGIEPEAVTRLRSLARRLTAETGEGKERRAT